MNFTQSIKSDDNLRAQESERALIASLLVNPNLLLGLKKIRPVMFSNTTLRKIFEIIQNRIQEQKAVDFPTIADESKLSVDILFTLVKYSDSINLKSISDKIVEKYIAREEITLNQKAINRIRNGQNAIKVLNDIQKERDLLHEQIGTDEETRLQRFNKVMEAVRRANTGDNVTFGLSTGYEFFDTYFSGWQKGNQLVLAGRPGQGKTSLALCILLIASMLGHKVLFVSIEMPERQILLKLVSLLTGVSVQTILGGLDETQQNKIDEAFEFLYDLPFWIVTDCRTIDDVKNEVRLHNAKYNIDLVAVDYIQKIKGERGLSRNYQIEEISGSLCDLASESDCDVAMIALSQLSREVEKRQSKKPIMSDLKDSGSLEQDAFSIVFVYRPEYYKIMRDSNGNSTKGLVYLIVGKNRLGKTGTIKFSFDEQTGTFLEGPPNEEKENPFLKFPAKEVVPSL